MDFKRKITNRAYGMMILLMIVFVLVAFKIGQIQFVDKEHYLEIANQQAIKSIDIKARRGNVYAEDGSLLATTITKYDISIDPTVSNIELFNSKIKSLSDSLRRHFGASVPRDFLKKVTVARAANKRYFKIINNLSYDQYKLVSSFPILKEGRYKGGIIVEERMVREHPLGKVAERTIGYEKDFGAIGLEGSYSSYLAGEDGRVLSMKLQNGNWKPLSDFNEREPKDGADIYSTIDIHIQDVSHYALLRQLEYYEADHGTVVVMEVKTGKIKSIVNLGRNKEGKYFEKINYAIFESAEPGSTFKLPALVAALEDGVVDTSKVIDTGVGRWTLYNKTIRDSHEGGLGRISVKRIFEESSNVGMAKLVYDNYKDNPSKFVDRLYSMNLGEMIGINIKGEQQPYIPSPNSSKWSGLSLAWMAYGYEVHMTPLQILTFYNAIANNGVEVKPYLVSKIVGDEGEKYSVGTEIINSRICSQKTVQIAQSLLEGVVKNGTGKFLDLENLKIAGKTGTTQLNYWEGKETMGYSSSFVGYFPADNPKYSMIVVVNKPNKTKGYYGAQVAAPVFKEIALKIYNEGPEIDSQDAVLAQEDLLNQLKSEDKKKETIYGVMPEVIGYTVSEAVAVLENLGLEVDIQGQGSKVISQSIEAGVSISKGNNVLLSLSR